MFNDSKQPVCEQQIGNAQIIKKPTSKAGIFSPSVGFIKKHKLATAITIAIITIIIGLFAVIPSISLGELKLVNLNTSVKLEVGQTAKLKSSDVSVELTHLANITCPEGRQCFGSGQVIEYALTVNGKKYVTTSALKIGDSKYQVKFLSSDYKTYAVLKIVKS